MYYILCSPICALQFRDCLCFQWSKSVCIWWHGWLVVCLSCQLLSEHSSQSWSICRLHCIFVNIVNIEYTARMHIECIAHLWGPTMQWIACQKRNGGLSGWFGSQLQCIATHFFITQPHSHTYILSHTALGVCFLVGVDLCMPCDMYLYFCVNKYKKYLYQCCTERVSGEGWGLVGSTKPGLIRHARIEFPPAPAANTNTIIHTNTKTREANT